MSQSLQRKCVARAIEIISDENKWCKGAMFAGPNTEIDRNNKVIIWEEIHSDVKTATRFCAIGAMYKALFEMGMSKIQSDELVSNIHNKFIELNKFDISIPYLNDWRGKEVLISKLHKFMETLT